VQPESRPDIDADPQSLAYIIYTSGTTGKPKGVAISQANIVNFLRVVDPVYDVRSTDRVYQGLSIAFDFSVEEIWPAWMSGATLIAGPTDGRRVGRELAQITVFACVPTLLTTIQEDLPDLRLLLASGEACPPDLVRRWARPGRRLLNAYGPTETTVTATWTELYPDKPVTIGIPLPSYTIYILNPDTLEHMPNGESGEIVIGGPGVGIGYVNRPDLTAQKFIDNPLPEHRERDPRLYRSGDLGRLLPNGEIEYQGRIDTQVKVRGYRIELGEIEEAIREDHEITNAVVTPLERDGVITDLVGYVILAEGLTEVDEDTLRQRLNTALRKRLPTYMIPTYVEILDAFPMLAADKVDRHKLPAPTSAPLGRGAGGQTVAPGTPMEIRIAALWAETMGPDLSVTDNFFTDLGGHSMSGARMISRLREEPDLQGLGMADLYAYPTIREMAAFLSGANEPEVAEIQGPMSDPAPPHLRHSTLRVWTYAVAQFTLTYFWTMVFGFPAFLFFYRACVELKVPLVGVPTTGFFSYMMTGIGIVPFLLSFYLLLPITALLIPIVGGRLMLIGLKPGWYPLWGWTYLRLTVYSKLMGFAPIGMVAGTPAIGVVLRLLGAKVGKRCHIAGGLTLPKMITIGNDTSFGYGVKIQPYLIERGWLRIAPIRIGDNVQVGTNSVVMPGARIGHNATVAEQSLVAADQIIFDNRHVVGSPSRCADRPERLRELHDNPDRRRWPVRVLLGFLGASYLSVLTGLLSLAPTVAIVVYAAWHPGLVAGMWSVVLAGPLFTLSTCLLVIMVKRLVMWRARPGVYTTRSAFGVRKWMSDNTLATSLTATQSLYSTLYLVPFLKALGTRMGKHSELATVSFVDPDMMIVGPRCFLADISVIAPAVFHRGRISLQEAEVGDRTFVGNGAVLPGGASLGDDSLVGVHSLAPTEPVKDGQTWLGSPAIFLPRREGSQKFDDRFTFEPSRYLIFMRYFVEFFRVTGPATIGTFCVLVSLLGAVHLVENYPPYVLYVFGPLLAFGAGLLALLIVAVLKLIIIGRYKPRTEPLWSVWVRRTELITGLYENLLVPGFIGAWTGTPLMRPFLRLLGVKIGKRCWIGTTYFTEFDLVTVGDDVCIGENTSLQTHLFEDRVMKMSYVRVESDSSIGTRSVVLYDATVGTGTSVDAMSLVMKGETLPAHTLWRGIPARAR
jgi:non-ribosomal peptide synthetase-like protein